MRIDQALEIARKARIRRYAMPARNDAVSSSEPSPQRGSNGRYLRGHLPSSRGRPPGREELRTLFINDVFAVWKTHGRAAIRQLAEDSPAIYLRFVASLANKMRRSSGDQ